MIQTLMMGFREKLIRAVDENNSLLCVGLDPDVKAFPSSLRGIPPQDAILEFNRIVIESTQDLVCAYKPNLGFYVQHGMAGLHALEATRAAIPNHIPVILDCKIGDFSNTSAAYGAGFFDHWHFDAITISPYMGEDGLAPLMSRAETAVFVLCKTSNPGSGEFQDAALKHAGEHIPLHEFVAHRTRKWHDANPATVGLVVGATYPGVLQKVRQICPDQPILLPGIGAQSGDLAAALAVGLDSSGGGLVVSASRSILYPRGSESRGDPVRHGAAATRDAINKYR